MAAPKADLPEIPNAGLCGTCEHARSMQSDRGSVFLLCQLSFDDPSFAKYPRLPVVACRGYQPATGAES